MLKTHIKCILEQQKAGTMPAQVEILIVDDGSRDKTWTVIQEWVTKYSKAESGLTVRGFRQKVNQGKGMAVKYGVLFSRGEYILMVDADGATDFNEIGKVYKIAKETKKNELSCVIGNRNHAENTAQVQRKGIRKLLNSCMTMLVKFVLGFGYQDTQCGFKIFSRDAAKRIFPTQHLERWAFDIEVLFLCR